MSLRDLPTADVFAQAIEGSRRAIGRCLSHIENGGALADEIAALAHPRAGQSHVVGITGAPGAGKSTLTGQLIKVIGESGCTPAVLAVDPSSPLTGGAILGDRIRMDGVATPDTFIRSMATRGHQGGLALAVPGVVRMLDAAGYEPVIIETVGVGQVEVDIAGTADTTVVVVTPGWGDAVQANKAGLLEVADVFVVNKADRPGANDARRDLELMLDLSHVTGQDQRTGFRPEIVMTTAIAGDGADKVWQAIVAHRSHLEAGEQMVERRSRRDRAEVRNRIVEQIGERASAHLESPAASDVLAQVEARTTSPAAAADTLIAQILSS